MSSTRLSVFFSFQCCIIQVWTLFCWMQTIRLAIHLGGDTDTIASMAGAISGCTTLTVCVRARVCVRVLVYVCVPLVQCVCLRLLTSFREIPIICIVSILFIFQALFSDMNSFPSIWARNANHWRKLYTCPSRCTVLYRYANHIFFVESLTSLCTLMSVRVG